MAASPTPYAADGSATVFGGEEVVLTVRVEPADQMADDAWEQRVIAAGVVVASAVGAVVSSEEDGLPELAFTLSAAATGAFLPADRSAVDLIHHIVRDPGGADDVVLAAAFRVRLGVR